ncbi:MAG: zf-HC2 domain-containing protein [Candidatus Omnitrophica bacterium]|nr:zf-HC2 domain-containing protein [Candidatus Omnitrophota bacterium]
MPDKFDPKGRDCCARLRKCLSDYMEGDLDSASCQGLEAHMDSCPSCRHFVETLKSAVGLFREYLS